MWIDLLIIQVTKSWRWKKVSELLRSFEKFKQKKNNEALILELGSCFTFKHSAELSNGIVMATISTDHGIMAFGKIMQFPRNMILAAAYRILFHKMNLELECSNPHYMDKLPSQSEITAVKDRNQRKLRSHHYKKDEVKNSSSGKLQLHIV